MLRKFVFGSVSVLLVASCATNSDSDSGTSGRTRKRLEYDSAQLMMKNSDQMNDLIKKKMQIADNAQAGGRLNTVDEEGVLAEPEAIEALTDAMRIALSRPDQDGTREALFARLRRELVDLSALERVLKSLTQESIDAVKSEASPKVQATYLTILENLMAEVKPEVDRNDSLRKIVESIRDAKLKISDDVQGQQRLQTMKHFVSPSETAAKMLSNKKKK